MNYLSYPKTFKENFDYRLNLYEKAEKDKVLQKELKVYCKDHPEYFVDVLCWTKDTRLGRNSVLPFITYPCQENLILETKTSIRDGVDLLIEKSRDMGVSWCVLFAFMHEWMFEPGADFRVGSRKEDYVDKLGDIDTLLEKVRFALKYLPAWILPKGFVFGEHDAYMRIINPENKNAIVGESANPNFGSGGRRRAILLDEFAKWEPSIAEAAWTSTADVTPCRIVVSTPVGSGNKFAQLASGTKEKIRKLTIHWTMHPKKAEGAYYLDAGEKIPIKSMEKAFSLWEKLGRGSGLVRSPWYDAEAERRSESDLAQEVDIDYLRSGHPFFTTRELAKQRIWKLYERKSPADPIPYGCFIMANLVEIDHKIELRENPDGWLRVFELPRKDYQYVASADVSEGLAKGDEDFLVVRDKSTRNTVAAFNGLRGTDEFATMIQKVAKFYNGADAVPESNNHGHSVCQDLKNMDCKLYHTKKLNEQTGRETIIRAGWTTTPVTRPKMLDQMEEEIRRHACELRDETLIKQCFTFVKNPKTGKPSADGEYLDDGVMAFAIAGAVIQEKPYKAKKQSSTHAKQKEAVRKAETRKPFRFATSRS